MLAGPEPIPLTESMPAARFNVRLVGDADAVAWVAANLRGPGFGIEAESVGEGAAADGPPGSIVWVARPGEPEPGKTLVDDAAVWSFPCLVVIPPGGSAPDILAGHPSVESFEVVREPDDAPILRMRLERLLLLHRRRTQTEAVLHDLPVVVYSRTLDGILTSVNAETESFLGKDRASLVGRSLLEVLPEGAVTEADLEEMNEGLLARGRHRRRLAGTVEETGRHFALDTRALLLRDGHGTPWGAQVVIADLTDEEEAQERLRVQAGRSEILAAIATATRDITDLDRILQTVTSIVGRPLRRPHRRRLPPERTPGPPRPPPLVASPRRRFRISRATNGSSPGPMRFTCSSNLASPTSSPMPGRRDVIPARPPRFVASAPGAGSSSPSSSTTRSSRGSASRTPSRRRSLPTSPRSWRSSPTSSRSPSAPPASTRASPRS